MSRNQSAQALFHDDMSNVSDVKPLFELERASNTRIVEMGRRHATVEMSSPQIRFSTMPTSRVLCKCGAVVEADSSILRTKRSLNKVVECRHCRSNRISAEKDELDREFFGLANDEE